MNFLTHVGISKTLHRHLFTVMELDKKSFVYGNIKPDLSPSCCTNPHLEENYYNLVIGMAEELRRDSHSIEEFSEKLGVICHYLSDFFCYYHLDRRRYKKHLMHLLYELCLHFKFQFVRHKIEFKLTPFETNQKVGIEAILSKMKSDYTKEKHSLRSDIEYALQTAILVSQTIYQTAKIAAINDGCRETKVFSGLSA